MTKKLADAYNIEY